MPLIEIRDVQLSEPTGGPLWGCYLDMPQRGTLFDGSLVDTWGWVLGRSSAAVAVEFVAGGKLLRRVPVSVMRPDLPAVFPHVPGADRSGFRTVIPIEGRAAELRIEVRAVLKDGSRAPLGVVLARRRWRESNGRPGERLVSIVIPCFNQAHYLAEAIESARVQTHPHVEVVVVDDGSPDNTFEVASRYPGVRYVRQDNQGLSSARNTGLRRTNGDYLVFLDADDRLMPTAVESGLKALDAHPEAAFTSGRCRWIAADGSPLPTPEQGTAQGDHYAALLRSSYIAMPATVMYRRGVFEAVRGFDPSFHAAEDHEISLRIARDFPVCCHDDIVAEYRQRGAGMSRDLALMLQSVLAAMDAERRYVRSSREHRAAYIEGRRFLKRHYGARLAHHVVGLAHRREWRRCFKGAWVLMRCYPAGLLAALTGSATLE